MYYVTSILRILFSWPLIAFIIIMIFRKDISALLKKITEIHVGKLVLKLFDKDTYSSPQIIQSLIAVTDDTKKISGGRYDEKYGDLYWAGHDLMWTINALMVGKEKVIIIHGLTKALQHLCSLGFSPTLLYRELEDIKSKIESTPPKELDASTRTDIIETLWGMKNHFGAIIESAQKEYKP